MNIQESKQMVGKKFEVRAIVQFVEKKVASNSKPFLSFNFVDASGEIGGIMWSDGIKAEHDNLKAGSVVCVRGIVNTYNNTVNYNLNTVDAVEVTKEEKMCLMPCLDAKKRLEYEAMWYGLVEKIDKESNYRKIFDVMDGVIKNYLFVYPAAKGHHHNYIGGLLEHTCNVANGCICMAMNYDVDRNLLIAGALLHDIGKIKEYTFETGVIDRTDDGRMLGHISLGVMMLSNTLREQCIELVGNEKRKLIHMILSHHGKKEYGSPIEPMMLESFILSSCDYLDFLDGHFTDLKKDGKEVNYSKLLSSYVYL